MHTTEFLRGITICLLQACFLLMWLYPNGQGRESYDALFPFFPYFLPCFTPLMAQVT